MGLIDKLLSTWLQPATIVHKAELSKAVYHIRIKGEQIKTADYVPGYFLRLGVGMGNDKIAMSDKVRSYSVWHIDKSNGTIDMAITTHGKGSGTEWARQCAVGSSIPFAWHQGKFVLDNSADSYLLMGDLSALAHLYEINRNLSGKTVKGIFYSDRLEDLFADTDGTTPFDFYALNENPAEEMISKANELLSGLPGKKIVYIAGDSRLCIALNNHFRKTLKWETKQIKVKLFWNPDKKGLE